MDGVRTDDPVTDPATGLVMSPRQEARLERVVAETAERGAHRPIVCYAVFAADAAFRFDLFVAAVRDVVAAHATLRARFPVVAGRRGLAVAAGAVVEVVEVVERVATDEGDARAWLAAETRRAFDLERGPMVRLALARLPAGRQLFGLLVEHLVFDGVSLGVMLREVGAAHLARLRGTEAGLDGARSDETFARFARRQAELLAGPEGARRLAYWRSALEPGQARPLFDLDPSYDPALVRSDRVTRTVPGPQLAGLTGLARRCRCSVYAVHVAALLESMRLVVPHGPVGFVSPIANRTAAEFDSIGLYTDYAVVRTPWPAAGGEPTELVPRAAAAVLGAVARHYPYAQLVREIDPGTYLRPDTRCHLSLLYTTGELADPAAQLGLPGVTGHVDLHSPSEPPHPLSLAVRHGADAAELSMWFSGFADPAPVERFLDTLAGVLRRFAACRG